MWLKGNQSQENQLAALFEMEGPNTKYLNIIVN